jgi:hypothetical protein
MKTKILKLLKEAKTEKEINNIVDNFYDIMIFDYDLMNALRDAKQRVLQSKSNKKTEWKVYELN